MTGVAFTVGRRQQRLLRQAREDRRHASSARPSKADVIAKKERNVEKRVPCKLLHIDTDGDGKADTHIVAEGLRPSRRHGCPRPRSRDLRRRRASRSSRTPPASPGPWSAEGNDWMFNPDSIIPIFVTSALPRWFGVVFLLTLLSAAMSTMSSQFHTAGTAIGRDVFEQLIPPQRRRASQHARTSSGIGIIVGIIAGGDRSATTPAAATSSPGRRRSSSGCARRRSCRRSSAGCSSSA